MLEAIVPITVGGWVVVIAVCGRGWAGPDNSASFFAVVGKILPMICMQIRGVTTVILSSVKPENKERYRITSFFQILSFLPWFCEIKSRKQSSRT